MIARQPRIWPVVIILAGLGAARASAQDVVLAPIAVYDFGAVFIGESSPGFTVTIENRGAAGHVIDEIRLDETAAFILDTGGGAAPCGELPVPLEPETSCTVEVTFAPAGQGAFTGTLFVRSDDALLAATVVGEGQLRPDPTIAVEPLTVEFSKVNVGDTKGPVIVRIENRGVPDLELDAMSLDNQRLFQLNVLTAGVNPCGGTTPILASLDGCTIGVLFSPSAEGAVQTLLRLRSNDPTTPEAQVLLTGTGTPESSGGGGGGCFLEVLRAAPAVSR